MSFPHSIVNVPKIPSSIAQTCLKLKMTFIDNKVCLVKTDMSIVSTSQYRECQSVHIRVLRSQYRLMLYPTSDVFHRLCTKFWTWAVTAHTSYSVRYCYISQPSFPNFFLDIPIYFLLYTSMKTCFWSHLPDICKFTWICYTLYINSLMNVLVFKCNSK